MNPDYPIKIPNKLSINDLKNMSDKEFNDYCDKIIKRLCKSIADDLDFYDFKGNSTKRGALNEVN